VEINVPKDPAADKQSRPINKADGVNVSPASFAKPSELVATKCQSPRRAQNSSNSTAPTVALTAAASASTSASAAPPVLVDYAKVSMIDRH